MLLKKFITCYRGIKHFFWDKYFLRDEVLMEMGSITIGMNSLTLKIGHLKAMKMFYVSLNFGCYLLMFLFLKTDPLFKYLCLLCANWMTVRMFTIYRQIKMYEKKLYNHPWMQKHEALHTQVQKLSQQKKSLFTKSIYKKGVLL